MNEVCVFIVAECLLLFYLELCHFKIICPLQMQNFWLQGELNTNYMTKETKKNEFEEIYANGRQLKY